MLSPLADDGAGEIGAACRRNPDEPVLLVSMPLASPHHPSIGLSLLKGALARNGIGAKIRHLYLDFVEHLGTDIYDVVSDDRYFRALIGEWLFEPFVHDRDDRDQIGYLSRVLLGEYRETIDAVKVLKILEARNRIDRFLEHCLEDVAWNSYRVVGFSSCFQQSMASLAMARLVKSRYPEIFMVMGGANCEGEMGVELHRRYPFVDAVVAGEAEETFPELVGKILAGESPVGLAGVTTRADGSTIEPLQSGKQLQNLDELPYLDYDEFYEDRKRTPNVSQAYTAVPLFETARGCWWGQKHHCTFCGLNALGMAYRSKSQERALSELVDLTGRYGKQILVVDNILDMKYFERFIPRLADDTLDLLIHYEVKSNLTNPQISLLSRAGIRKIQPGIESLSTNVLRLMRKGTTMLRNVQILKFAAEAGVYVEWGHLYGFPGETWTDYQQIVNIVPALTHLSPPSSIMRVRADRFSPFFNEPGSFEITIHPLSAYAHIYPFGERAISRLAYHFDIVKSDESSLRGSYAALDAALQDWNKNAVTSQLTINSLGDGGATILDRRSGDDEEVFAISVCSAEILASAGEIRGLERVRETLSPRFGRNVVNDSIEQLIEQRLLLREDSVVLALPLRQPGWRRAPTKDEIPTSYVKSFAHRGASTRVANEVPA